MRYHWFRQCGLFVGSGVVEAGCKSVIGQRLKQIWSSGLLACWQLEVVQTPNSGSGFSSASNAEAWLAQSDVTTAGEILSSVAVDSTAH